MSTAMKNKSSNLQQVQELLSCLSFSSENLDFSNNMDYFRQTNRKISKESSTNRVTLVVEEKHKLTNRRSDNNDEEANFAISSPPNNYKHSKEHRKEGEFSLIPSGNARFAKRLETLKSAKKSPTTACTKGLSSSHAEVAITIGINHSAIDKTTFTCLEEKEHGRRELSPNSRPISLPNQEDSKHLVGTTVFPMKDLSWDPGFSTSKVQHLVNNDEIRTSIPTTNAERFGTCDINNVHRRDSSTTKIHGNACPISAGSVVDKISFLALTKNEVSDSQIQLPSTILLEFIGSYLDDRTTWNAIATLNRETYALSKSLQHHLYRPWPCVRWRVTSGRPWAVAFGRDYVACGTDKGNIFIWRVYEDGVAYSLQGHCGRVNSVKCHGDWLVSSGEDKQTRIWNVQTLSCEAVLDGHTGSITSVAILNAKRETISSMSSSCMLLATASRDSDIRLYVVSYEGSKVLSTKPLITLTEAHQGPVNSIAMDEKDRQCRLISGGSDEQLRLWDICCTGDIFDESPCSDSSCNSKPGERKKSIFSYEGEIRSIAISKDHEQIAAAFDQCVFHTRHEKEGDASSVFLGNNDCRKNWRVLKGHSSNIRCIEFSPDGKLIATACSDGSIRLWKVGAGTYIRKWKAHNGFMVCSLAFSVDGRRLLSAGSDGTVAIEVI